MSHVNAEENQEKKRNEQWKTINFEENTAPRKSKRDDCPLNIEELGNRTWGFLHTMVAYYPENPTTEDECGISQFFSLFCRFYPCRSCAEYFTNLLSRRSPETKSQKDLSQWLCWAHNQVNEKLEKPQFDCSLLDERWKYGWRDGSCE